MVGLSLAGAVQAAPQVQGTLVPTSMIGDANGDGVADSKDLSIVQTNMNRVGGRAQGDFDGNGFINSNDLTLLQKYYLRTQPAAYFGKIADTTTAIPSGAGAFVQLNAPVMDKSGNVGFLGIGNTSNGVYRWAAGSLLKAADLATPIPGGTGNFVYLGQPTISIGRLAFRGKGQTSDGLYAFTNGALSKIVGNGATRPDGGTFISFADPAMLNSSLTFMDDSNQSDVRAYYYTGGVFTPVVRSSVSIPGGSGTFEGGVENPVTDGSNFWFVGHGVGQVGIYKKSNGVVSVVLDKNTPVPGTSNRFWGVSNLSSDNGNLAFGGKFGNASGIYSITPAGIAKVADTQTNVPGGTGKFTNFGLASAGSNAVAFVGLDQNQSYGIYAYINGELNRVIDSSVTLGGKIISSLELSKSAVVGNKVVFDARFTDGSSGIFSASILPTRVPGDVNNDGVVNTQDFVTLNKYFGKAVSRAGGDLNGDGMVNASDYQILERNIGRTGFAPLLGDTDGDGKVDNSDLRVLLSNLGKFGSVPQGDLNNDGKINFNDYQLMEQYLGKTSSSLYEPFGSVLAGADALFGESVPEPGMMMLMGAAVLGLMGRRRR